MDICHLSALEMAALLGDGQISARELLDHHLARIERLNPAINALVTLTPERARQQAFQADQTHAKGGSSGLLHGLPVAHKDLFVTAGIRTTFGSPIFSDFVPPNDALIVERQRRAGAMTVGKTNTPEFGAGSHTFNPVFGATRNPYDLTRTPGGSSGGAAAALAARMLPLCDGSDLGGSLRNPAAFCNVVGFRPSPGRVPSITAHDPWSPLPVEGPMARTVSDLTLYLRAMAGPDHRAAWSIEQSPDIFAGTLARDLKGTRVAWSPDAGGLPIHPDIRAALESIPDRLSDLGCEVTETWPDLSDAPFIFQARRAWLFAVGYAPLLEQSRHLMKDTVAWNIEAGLKMTISEYASICRRHRELISRVHRFMDEEEGFDFLAAPVTQVPPFPIEVEYPTEIDGTRMETYVDWMRSCSDLTVTTLPIISVPGGFTADGLPVGLQLIGRYRKDRSVLELAYGWEQATGWGKLVPPEPTAP
ncbi:MAG: amidase [Acidimicrobiia bacterium]|nr:amidase [Acidimicrobiia bacterium]MYD04632.1 amidase [Acidimicrobiia bacterium]